MRCSSILSEVGVRLLSRCIAGQGFSFASVPHHAARHRVADLATQNERGQFVWVKQIAPNGQDRVCEELQGNDGRDREEQGYVVEEDWDGQNYKAMMVETEKSKVT